MSALPVEKLRLVEARVANEKRSVGIAYLLFFFVGALGIHNFYLGRIGRGLAEIGGIVGGWVLVFSGVVLTAESGRSTAHSDLESAGVGTAVVGVALFFVAGILLLIDLFTIPSVVDRQKNELRLRLMAEME